MQTASSQYLLIVRVDYCEPQGKALSDYFPVLVDYVLEMKFCINGCFAIFLVL